MASFNSCCQLVKEEGSSRIQLSGTVTILQAAVLRNTLKKAIRRMEPIRVDMLALDEIDVSVLQLLYAGQEAARMEGLEFSLSSMPNYALSLIFLSGFPLSAGASEHSM